MSENKKDDLEILEGKDENVHFDMYHFFKRKDVVIAAIAILGLVLAALYFMMATPQSV